MTTSKLSVLCSFNFGDTVINFVTSLYSIYCCFTFLQEVQKFTKKYRTYGQKLSGKFLRLTVLFSIVLFCEATSIILYKYIFTFASYTTYTFSITM